MLRFNTSDPTKNRIETLILPVCEDSPLHAGDPVRTLIDRAGERPEFSGEKGDVMVLYDPDGINAGRVILAGLGKAGKADAEAFRALAGKMIRRCMRMKLPEATIAVPSAGKTGTEEKELLTALMEGACLGNHVDNRYKQEKKQTPLQTIDFLVDEKTAAAYEYLPSRVEAVCAGTVMAREWVNLPANDKQPEVYAEDIAEKAAAAGLKVTVLDETALREKGFGALMAVTQGSESKARLVILEYQAEKAEKTVALVGKGVTFDTGGLNLKISGSMSDMKQDMAGSAAVAATLLSAPQVRPGVNLIGVLPLVENMVSANAIRPGDVIRTYAGKTVEIGNTDAEGRLILIDAIAYTIETMKPDILIDMATLTGACVVALGEGFAGVFSEDDELTEALLRSGRRTFERCWRMPLPDDYRELLKSNIADLNNMSRSKRWAGAITAALFLSEFVKDTRWAHIDIAGPAFIEKESAYCGAGGTGFGVRLFWDFLNHLL